MAGNTFEWTMEAFSDTGRILRGGQYGNTGSIYPASYRGHRSPNVAVNDCGFRPALYII